MPTSSSDPSRADVQAVQASKIPPGSAQLGHLDILDTDPRPLRDAAMTYVARGWRVFPVYEMQTGRCACGSAACESPGKHPRTANGCTDASTDAAQLRAWWKRWPTANVAIATGTESNLIVIDVDPDKGGADGLADLEIEHGRIPNTVTVITGSGGAHYYLEHPRDRRIGNRVNLYPGVDVRGDGGYVVAPPSNHRSGKRYAWDAVLGFDDVPVAECVPAMLGLLSKAPNHPAKRAAYASSRRAFLSDRVRALVDRNRAIRDRFTRLYSGRDRSPSGVDMGLASLLAMHGCAAEEIDGALRASREWSGLPIKHDLYFELTVGRALASRGERS